MHIERHFTNGSFRPHDKAAFVSRQDLSVPHDWSLEAVESFKDALAQLPCQIKTVEENTTPSLLWSRRPADKTKWAAEDSALAVFDRIAGAAAYYGWKAGLWDDENSAAAFYDEARAILLSRHLVIAPQDMARMGLDWACGQPVPQAAIGVTNARPVRADALILQNETIDSLLRDTHPLAQGKWQRFLENSQGMVSSQVLFADTMMEWGSAPNFENAPQAMLNLLAFRKPDGKIDVVGLGQASKIATLLLDLHYEAWTKKPHSTRPLKLGIGNISSLLMSLGLAYDSHKARGTIGALTASITATATITSAQIAGKTESCPAYTKHQRNCLRILRNKIRAVFGEKTDYDHLSIVPQTLDVESGADLVLISTARYTSEEALRLVEKHGLRNLHLTSFYTDPSLAPLLDSTSQGIAPEATLTCDYATQDEDIFARRVRPALSLGLEQLGLEDSDIRAVIHHVAGYRTLIAAPVINHYTLRKKGFDDPTLEKLEAALRHANHLREAFTPWVLGASFCTKKLKINARYLKKDGFDILKHLGFTTKEIDVANAFCCGHRSVAGVSELNDTMRSVFVTQKSVRPEAITKMAAIAQTFITGDTDACVTVPSSLTPDMRAQIILKAWKQGLKSLALVWDGMALYREKGLAQQAVAMKRKTPGLSQKHQDKIIPLSSPAMRAVKPKATARTISLAPEGKRKDAVRRK